MEHFTPISSLLGGLLVGIASAALLLLHGRIAGISGILGGALRGPDRSWRLFFLAGLAAGGGLIAILSPSAFAVDIDRSLPVLALAGLLVGVGTRLGGGCTSGHGICGLSRFSKRSAVAVITFMSVAALTVWITGGAS
ncbi:MAG: YeeE/YedE thiosulfate transporter family protein [Myxococcota bacterium]